MRMSEKEVQLFKVIFPDSQIAEKMKLKKSKIAYSVLYGIAPFFKNELTQKLSVCKYLSVGFDEALNKVSQKTQMNINVRFWSCEDDQVCTRYFTSSFLSRSTSDHIRHSFKASLSTLNLKAVIQISMDGPNVNLKFYKDLKEELKNEDSPVLLNIGTCGLHAVHGAFKKGIQVTNWSLLVFFRCLYNLFKDVPARRALYTEYSGSYLFPLKFCSICWLQNEDVAQRAIDMLPHLRKFVEGVRKDKKEPSCASFKTISTVIEDQLLDAKLTFFKSVSAEVEPFLREYQTDAPMVPFLHSSLTSVIRNVMSRFVKEDVLKETTSIHRVDLADDKNLLSANAINLGYGTHSAIRKKTGKVSDRDILNFQKACATCLKAFTEKLLERSPLLYPLCNAAACFDPCVAVKESLGKKRIKKLLTIFEENKVIDANTAEKAEREYLKICSDKDIESEMKLYKRKDCRVHVFWRNIFHRFENCECIQEVMKIVMILYHGNANVERGFLVNSECLVENLQEDTLIAQRIVYDKIKSSVGHDISNFQISNSLMQSYRSARSTLTEATKRKEREAMNKEIEAQKKKKAKLQIKELNDKISQIKGNANKEIYSLQEEIKSINEDF